MEDWVIQPEWMPNLYYFAHNNADLYCHKIKSQIRQGTSSDGQMIVNTGVLPIQNGATCYLHPLNKFPALTELGSDSNLIILPHNVNVWNQPYMNHAYHIEHYIENSPQDSSLFSRLDKEIHNGYNCILMLTLSTHPPYTDQDPNLSLPQNMPEIMASYIRCCSTVDKGMGKWLENVTSDSIYDDFTIVITGDHRMLTTPDELRNYCESNNTPYYAGEGYCPLIIISPSIKQPIVINEPLLQMDIYPTVLHLLGKEKLYWWKGLGINVLDSSAIRNRPITEKDAYAISDKIIRSDYFNSLIPNVAHPR